MADSIRVVLTLLVSGKPKEVESVTRVPSKKAQSVRCIADHVLSSDHQLPGLKAHVKLSLSSKIND